MSELAIIPRPQPGRKSSSAGSVLIIDDEAAIRESLETLLEMEGYEVQSAATADEGLARIGRPAVRPGAARLGFARPQWHRSAGGASRPRIRNWRSS